MYILNVNIYISWNKLKKITFYELKHQLTILGIDKYNGFSCSLKDLFTKRIITASLSWKSSAQITPAPALRWQVSLRPTEANI